MPITSPMSPAALKFVGRTTLPATLVLQNMTRERGGNQAFSVAFGQLKVSVGKPTFDPNIKYEGALDRAMRRSAALAAATVSRSAAGPTAAQQRFISGMDRLMAAGR